MSKYKPLTEPITRQEGCLLVDRKRFDAAVRSGEIVSLGKRGEGGKTSPLMFDQEQVRNFAKLVVVELTSEARDLKTEAKAIAKRTPPVTRRQIAAHLGKRLTGILIRSGALQPDGVLTDTQTAAYTYSPEHVAEVVVALADTRAAEAKLIREAAKFRFQA